MISWEGFWKWGQLSVSVMGYGLWVMGYGLRGAFYDCRDGVEGSGGICTGGSKVAISLREMS